MKKNINQILIVCFLILNNLIIGCRNPNLNTKTEINYPKSHRVFWDYSRSGVILATDEMPQYDVGDAFLYDNDLAKIIVENYGKVFKWFISDDSYLITHQNVFLPFLKKETSGDADNAIIIENSFMFKENFLWPLRVGLKDEIYVTEKRSYNNKKISEFYYRWSCLVKGDETIVVASNKFDTFVVECKKTRANVVLEKQILYYAPEAGYLVKIIKEERFAPKETSNLVAYGLAPSALPDKLYNNFTNLVQNALETRISGNNLMRKEQDILMEITPVSS